MNVSELFDYEVRDSSDRKVGTVEAVWEDERTGAIEFLGVRTTWLVGRIHLVPYEGSTTDATRRAVVIRWDEDRVKRAPDFDPSDMIRPDQEARIYAHFGLGASARPTGSGARPTSEGESSGPTGEHTHRALRHEEHLRPGSWPPGP